MLEPRIEVLGAGDQAKTMMSQNFSLRKNSEIPFYCKPVSLFLCVWLMMLVSFQMHFSVDSYPDLSLALSLFALSFGSLLLGYFTVRAAARSLGRPPDLARHYHIDLTRLRRVQAWLVAIAVAILLMNLITEGKPPIFGFFGADTLKYSDYGKLKQLLIGATMALLVSTSFETSRKRKILAYIFSRLSDGICDTRLPLGNAESGTVCILSPHSFKQEEFISDRGNYLILRFAYCQFHW